jgi:hypothetical protein
MVVPTLCYDSSWHSGAATISGRYWLRKTSAALLKATVDISTVMHRMPRRGAAFSVGLPAENFRAPLHFQKED